MALPSNASVRGSCVFTGPSLISKINATQHSRVRPGHGIPRLRIVSTTIPWPPACEGGTRSIRLDSSLFLCLLFRSDFEFFSLPDLAPDFIIINIPTLDYKKYISSRTTSFRVRFPLKVTALGGGRRSAHRTHRHRRKREPEYQEFSDSKTHIDVHQAIASVKAKR